MQKTVNSVLPECFQLQKLHVTFSSMTRNDWGEYFRVYSDPELMKHITNDINEKKIKQNFEALLNVQSVQNPKYRSYKIITFDAVVGILGLKWHDNRELQFGVILHRHFQHKGSSKKIKEALIAYAYSHLNVSKMVAFCAMHNGAANHVNNSLGMKLSQVKNNKTGQVFNKWEI